MVNSNCPVFGHYIRDGMAQTSSLKSSIRYQVCNTAVDNDISHISSINPSEQGQQSSITDDDLCEITISPLPTTTIKKTSLSLSSPNHYTSSRTPLIPPGHTSATVIKPTKPCSPTTHPLGSVASIHSLSKQTHIQQQQQRSSINSSLLSHNHSSTPRPSIFGTLATTLTAARKSSTSAFALAHQQLTNDHRNLFSGYQGKTF